MLRSTLCRFERRTLLERLIKERKSFLKGYFVDLFVVVSGIRERKTEVVARTAFLRSSVRNDYEPSRSIRTWRDIWTQG